LRTRCSPARAGWPSRSLLATARNRSTQCVTIGSWQATAYRLRF